MEIIDTSFIQKAAKNAGILTEIRKINISDVKVGPAILLMNMAKSVVYIDENKLYNPEIQIEEDLILVYWWKNIQDMLCFFMKKI
jgi:hypothetical protein